MTATKRHRMKKLLLLSLFFLPTFHSELVSNTSDMKDFFGSWQDSTIDYSTPPEVRVYGTTNIKIPRQENNIASDVRGAEMGANPDEILEILDEVKGRMKSTEKESVSSAAGRFIVLHSPKSINFVPSKNNPTFETLLSQIYLASFGLTINEKAKWDGFHILDPFDLPRAIVQISVDGFHVIESAKLSDYVSNDSFANVMVYLLTMASYQPNVFQEVKKRVEQSFIGNKMINIKLSDSKSLSELLGDPLSSRRPNLEVLRHLKITVKKDKDFLEELANLGILSWKVYNNYLMVPNRTMVDFYDFKFTSMHPLVDHHGPNSPAVIEARGLLLEAVKMFRDAFTKSYSQNVLVTMVTAEITHDLRNFRETYSSALREGDIPSPKTYSPDFPVIFNIVLWLFVTIGLSIVAICTAFMQMAADVKPVCLFAPNKKDYRMAEI